MMLCWSSHREDGDGRVSNKRSNSRRGRSARVREGRLSKTKSADKKRKVIVPPADGLADGGVPQRLAQVVGIHPRVKMKGCADRQAALHGQRGGGTAGLEQTHRHSRLR